MPKSLKKKQLTPQPLPKYDRAESFRMLAKRLTAYCLADQPLSKWEVVIALGLFIVGWLVLSWYLYIYNINFAYGDSTFVAQIFYNFKSGLVMTSPYLNTITEVIKTVWYQHANVACSQPLIQSYAKTPVLIHLYLAGYLFIPFAHIFAPDVLLAGAHAFFYTTVLAFAYFFARDRRLSVGNAGLITLLVSQHPLWYTGVTGQFYFNRMFLLFSALVIWALTRKRINYYFLLGAVILSVLTNEIYGIVIFFILVGYALLTKQQRQRLIPIGIASLFFSYGELKFIQDYNHNFTTQTNYIQLLTGNGLGSAWERIKTTIFDGKSFIYGFVNFSFLGILTIFKPILILYLILFLLPNLFVGIGGAEKTGWSTHYHIGYFIPMIWLSIWSISSAKIKARYKAIILVILIVYTMLIDPTAPSLTVRPKPYLALKDYANKANFLISHQKYEYEYRDKLRAMFAKNDKIVGPEAILYNLYDHHISLYPMNIDSADKVLLVYDPTKTGDARFTSLAYGGEEAAGLTPCILQRLHKDGYDFEHFQVFAPWAVLSRSK